MSKFFCFHHYSPRTRIVSLNEIDKTIEPIWLCEKCCKIKPRIEDYIRTDKQGFRKAWYKLTVKPKSLLMFLFSILTFVGATLLLGIGIQYIKVTPFIPSENILLLIGIFGLAFLLVLLSDRLDNLHMTDCLDEMTKLGYFTRGIKPRGKKNGN